ncbi:hypothetical protein FE633_19575 [Streptomyces montanus]|uniref:Uncharacterized protein n=1 Tax=Streptomyces montanus TaxID=2580423 RepID=A0A5R9FUD9_9ACTN|nr:hypothetical protein [Streptomyces montanus]TLS44513.1 hypothetical protein FE633_19575 [Streptomyces montanus]
MRSVRELAAAAGALAATLALLVAGAPAAVAGGPTSVLLVSPNSGETASLYNSEQEYMRLSDLLLADPGRALDNSKEKPPEPDFIGRHINVTWMIHDVTPWRVDMIHPDVAGSRSVWILTQLKMDLGTSEPSQEIWHQAKNPDELRALLTDLGVMSKHPKGTNPDSGPEQPSGDISAAAPAGTPAAGAGGGTDWWWAIPGLAAGATLALMLRPVAVRLSGAGPLGWWRKREAGPRQELRDV